MSDYKCSLTDEYREMDKLLISYLLFHHNLMIFGFRECITFFISASLIEIIFMLGNFTANESFRIWIASPYILCWMFNSSEIVVKKLFKALAMFVGSFNFSSFTSKLGTCSTECTFPASLFIMVHVVFILP